MSDSRNTLSYVMSELKKRDLLPINAVRGAKCSYCGSHCHIDTVIRQGINSVVCNVCGKQWIEKDN